MRSSSWKVIMLAAGMLFRVILAGAIPWSASAKTLTVMTSTEDMAALAREVGGDRVKVESVARGYQDPHFVEAKPSLRHWLM